MEKIYSPNWFIDIKKNEYTTVETAITCSSFAQTAYLIKYDMVIFISSLNVYKKNESTTYWDLGIS